MSNVKIVITVDAENGNIPDWVLEFLKNSNKIAEAKIAEAKIAEAKIAEAKIAEAKIAEAKIAEAKIAEAKTAEAKTAEAKTAEAKTTEATVIKIDQVRSELSKKVKDFKDEIIEKLASYKAKNVSTLDKKHYSDFINFLNGLSDGE